jgi:glycosyltransferase involved in cell wall biosynthesis
MKKMIIFSTLFFNKVGNQSMLETVKHYSKYFDVYIITASSSKDAYYLTSDEAKELLPNNVHFYRQSSWFKNIFRSLFRLIKKIKFQNNVKKAVALDNVLINLDYSFLNIISFKVTYFSLFAFAGFLKTLRILPSADFICGYEIGGVVPANRFKRVFNSKATLFSKMQGTVLFDAVSKGIASTDRKYSLDNEAYRKLKNFDLVCMTNDGTHGDKVLEHYGVSKLSYLHVMNGIAEGIVKFSHELNYIAEERAEIKLVTVSRLVGWKRVYLGIEILNNLVNLNGRKEYKFDVYGHGNQNEINFLDSLIGKYGLQNYVTVHGQVSHAEVASIMVDADFILSLYRMTNVTNPLLEAMFLNVPVLTLSDSSLLSIVKNDERMNRYIFDETDEDSLVEEISGFLNECDIKEVRQKRLKFNGTTPSELMTWERRINTEVNKLNSIR